MNWRKTTQYTGEERLTIIGKRFNLSMLLFVFLVGLVIAYTLYSQRDSSLQSIEDIQLNWSPKSLGYEYEPASFTYIVTLHIVNPSPLDVVLTNTKFSFYVEDELKGFIPLEPEIVLHANDSYNFSIPRTSGKILDPSGEYYTKLVEYKLDYRVVLDSKVSCGSTKRDLTRIWEHEIGFKHTEMPGPAKSLAKSANFILELDEEYKEQYVKQFNYDFKLDSYWWYSEKQWHFTVDIEIINDGSVDMHVQMVNVRICNITYANLTVDSRTFDIFDEGQGYVNIPINSTYVFQFETSEEFYDSLAYLRTEFSFHFYELDIIEIIPCWLHKKIIES